MRSLTFLAKHQVLGVRVLVGCFFGYFFYSLWPDVGLLTAAGKATGQWDLTARVKLTFGLLAGVSFALGLATSVSALVLVLVLVLLLSPSGWLFSVELSHLSVVLILYALFAVSEKWFSPLECQLTERAHWRLPILYLFYLGFSISGISKAFYHGWLDGSAVHFICLDHSPLSSWFGSTVCDTLPGRVLGLFVLGAEILAFPLIVFRQTRIVAWSLITIVQLGSYLILPVPVVTTGMLIVQLFLFDLDWFKPSQRQGWVRAQASEINA